MINCMLDFVLPSPRFTCASRLFRISHFRTISHLPGKSWNFVTQRKHHSKKPVPAPIFTNPTHATRMFLNINRTMTSVSPPASFGQHDQARVDAVHAAQRFEEVRRLSSALQEAESKIAHLTLKIEEYQQRSTPPPAFDTNQISKQLEAGGFSVKQTEVVLTALLKVNRSYEQLNRETYSTKVELNERMLIHKAEFATLRSELQLLEKADFKMLKADYLNIDRKVEGLIEAAKVSAAKYNSQLQELENKLLKALLGSIATIITILMAAWRFLK